MPRTKLNYDTRRIQDTLPTWNTGIPAKETSAPITEAQTRRVTDKCDPKDEDQLRNSTNSGHTDEADTGIPAKETSAETTEAHSQSRSSPTPRNLQQQEGHPIQGIEQRKIPAAKSTDAHAPSQNRLNPTLHRRNQTETSDMPRTTHNSTNDSNVPQLQNSHRRRVTNDWHNDYNRIVNWQQAGTRRTDPRIDANWH